MFLWVQIWRILWPAFKQRDLLFFHSCLRWIGTKERLAIQKNAKRRLRGERLLQERGEGWSRGGPPTWTPRGDMNAQAGFGLTAPSGTRRRRQVVQTRFGKAAIVRSREPPLDDMNLFLTGADAPDDWRV